MKNLTLVLLAAAFMLGCHTRDQKKSADEPGKITWSLEELWKSDTLMRTSESVLFDADRGHLFVSCINGAPWEADGMGFIALLNTDGSIKTEKWVTGLDAPKGMGARDGLLYVADITRIVVIDIEKAEIADRVEVPGAVHLNDVDVGPDGRVWFTDSGAGQVWTLNEGGVPEPWLEGAFEGPNGIFVEEDRVLLALAQEQELVVIRKEDKSFKTVTDGIGVGDGVEYTGVEGYYLVTSWQGEIFLVLPDFSSVSLLKTSEQGINTADIGYNLADRVVYVPTFFDNRVVAYKLVKSAG